MNRCKKKIERIGAEIGRGRTETGMRDTSRDR